MSKILEKINRWLNKKTHQKRIIEISEKDFRIFINRVNEVELEQGNFVAGDSITLTTENNGIPYVELVIRIKEDQE